MFTESQTATEATTDASSEGEASQSGENGQLETDNGTESKEGQKPVAQPGKAKGSTQAEKAVTLAKLLKREKDDPNVKFNDKELDILEEHYQGKLQPAKKTKPRPAKAEEGDESESKDPSTEELPITEDGEEEPAKEEADEDTESEDEGIDPEAEALMKEVGAKSLKDALAKVKELRAKLGGSDAKAVAQMARQIQSEKHLMEDVAKGVPAAIDHFERAYGIKLARPNPNGTRDDRGNRDSRDGTGERRPAARPSNGNGERKRSYIPEEAFIDPESAKLANDVLRQRDLELDDLKGRVKDFDDERERNRKEAALTKAQSAVIDEMVQVAQGIPNLKAIGGLREAIAAWYQGKSDARMDAFNELFTITQAEGCSLKAAAQIKRGRDSEKLIAEAESRGRKSAYSYTPNPSLSGQQGGRGEKTTYQNLSDAQVEAMSENHTLMPADWFDAKDNPVQARIPKRAWKIFGFT